MPAGIGDDGSLALESVGDTVLALFLLIDLFNAVLQQFRQPALHQL